MPSGIFPPCQGWGARVPVKICRNRLAVDSVKPWHYIVPKELRRGTWFRPYSKSKSVFWELCSTFFTCWDWGLTGAWQLNRPKLSPPTTSLVKTARPDLKKSLSLDFKLVSHSELLTFDRVWATYTLLCVQYMCALTFRTFRSEDALIR